tara:strand:+ start:636 stop:746 length:111 start_codon:yes stop_codon:yes gene_type:complete
MGRLKTVILKLFTENLGAKMTKTPKNQGLRGFGAPA